MSERVATAEETEAQFIERNIRALVDAAWAVVERLEKLFPDALAGFQRHADELIDRLEGLVLGDPPHAYQPSEASEFGVKHQDPCETLCQHLRVAIRTLEFWVARTARPHGCSDLEKLQFRLTCLRDGREIDPVLRERTLEPGLAEDEAHARWFGRRCRETPNEPDADTEHVIAVLRNNPGGMTTKELTAVINAERGGSGGLS
jgi:hypothetical protein